MAAEEAVFTRAEIVARNHKEDAVFIIDNVVYDVTKFLDDHPGGAEVLIDNAGRDATQSFIDVGHSEDAKQWMRKFVVGRVAEEDRWERPPEPDAGESGDGTSLAGLAQVWSTPVLLMLLAFMLYYCLFG